MKAGFFGKGFPRGYSANFGRKELYQDENLFSELSLTTSEARLGTEKEILVKRGWGTERVIIYIAPGVKNDTVYSLSLEGEGGRREEKLYLKMKVVTN